MLTRIRKVCVRYVPTSPEEAERNRNIVLELQLRSIIAASNGRTDVSLYEDEDYARKQSQEIPRN